MRYYSRFFLSFFWASLLASSWHEPVLAQKPVSDAYQWKSVQISGGGFVDGFIYHPKVKEVLYARTDMGGAYRWLEKEKVWKPLLDWIPYQDLNLMGIESIALDPNNADMLYLACGTYTSGASPNGAILISKDRGETFKRVDVPFKFGGNEMGRGNGERMAVDPNFSNIIYLGTRQAGLWKSVDAGLTWKKLTAFPEFPEKAGASSKREWWNLPCGINMVVFDQRSKTDLGSTVYACVSQMNQNNLFFSKDGGQTWNPVAGQPCFYKPTHAVMTPKQELILTYGTNSGPWPMTNGAVWKYNVRTGRWTEISPIKHDPKDEKAFGYAAVSYDASHPDCLIVSSFSKGNDGDEIFRSIDGGKSWKSIFTKDARWDRTNAPYTVHTPLHWMFDVEIDPFNPDHALFTTGYGGWETFNLRDIDKSKPLTWSIISKGIEETVCLDLCSPPKGAKLISAIGDYCGFVHHDLDKVVAEGCFDHPHFNNTSGIACAEMNPDLLVRVGRASMHKPGKNIGYSLDAGKTWQATAMVPNENAVFGHVAVAADGASWIWTPEHDSVYYTTDRGTSWKASQGIPKDTRVVADKLNANVFYAVDLFGGKLYTSNDGGRRFTASPLLLSDGLPTKTGYRGDDRGGQDRIYCAPNKEADLWLAAFHGLYHKSPSGSFDRLPDVQEIHAFGFGKAAPGADYSALYLVGTVKHVRGIFRSDDKGVNWTRINDDAHQWGLILQITGDPKQYGRVYVGTHGRGIMYGDPQ